MQETASMPKINIKGELKMKNVLAIQSHVVYGFAGNKIRHFSNAAIRRGCMGTQYLMQIL